MSYDPAKTIVVSLENERHTKRIIEIADPEALVTRLRTARRK